MASKLSFITIIYQKYPVIESNNNAEVGAFDLHNNIFQFLYTISIERFSSIRAIFSDEVIIKRKTKKKEGCEPKIII